MSRHDQRDTGRLALQPVESDCAPALGPARRLARVEPLYAADGAARGYRVQLDNGMEAELPFDAGPRLH